MNNLLQVEHLNKQYPGFTLKCREPFRRKKYHFKIYFKYGTPGIRDRYHAGQRFLWT